MDAEKIKDLVFRALHTAWQAAAATWAVTDFAFTKAAAAAALGAALSALKTFIVAYLTVEG